VERLREGDSIKVPSDRRGIGYYPQCELYATVQARADDKASVEETKKAIEATREAGKILRAMPAPKRGEVVRQIREVLSAKVGELGDLVSLEMGKIKSEGKGEVQEVSRLPAA
jgi:acyl-CoA reductase-like NAD-dependent aldehyde dehydrogenase